MSEPYQIAVVVPDGLPAGTGIRRCHRILADEGIELAEDSLLALHDTGTEEPDPEPVGDGAAALDRLIGWPTLGTLDYAGPEGIVTVSYLGGAGVLRGVLVSAQERAVDRTGAVPRYQRLAARLHRELGASRTVMAWGLQRGGFDLDEEIDRLRAGRFSGEYALADLRR